MLSEIQKTIIEAPEKSVRVLAGAGSGKTRVLVERVKHMIAQGIAPETIIVFTFTRKAAKEVSERLGDVRIRVGTFHSICMQLLSEYNKQLVPISEEMADSLVDGINKTTKKKVPRKVIDQARINRALGKPSGSAEINRIVDTYEGHLMHEQAVDFLGMLLRGIALAKTLPAFHVIVDEAQDTDPLQWELVNTLRKDATEFTVGDDAQSIYAWRGVDDEAWLSRDAVQYSMFDTYRYGKRIASVSLRMLDALGMARTVVTSDVEDTVNYCESLSAMLPYVTISHSQGRSCAILVRYNSQVDEIKQLLCGVAPVAEKVVIDHSAALALFRYLSAPWSSVSHGEFLANKKASRLLPTLASEELSTDSCAIIAGSWLSSLESQTVGAVIGQLTVPPSLKESFAWWNDRYAGWSLRDAVVDFVTIDEETCYTDGIKVMTVHGAKGLEWDDVFVALPPVRRFSDEDWRIVYVALTRARRNLMISGTDNPAAEAVANWVEKECASC